MFNLKIRRATASDRQWAAEVNEEEAFIILDRGKRVGFAQVWHVTHARASYGVIHVVRAESESVAYKLREVCCEWLCERNVASYYVLPEPERKPQRIQAAREVWA